MKKLFVVSFVFLSMNLSYASDEAVILSPDQVYTINTPQPIDEVLGSINHKNHLSEDVDSNLFEPEEDIATNKLEKGFYNFVNNRVVNNKLSIFSASLGRENYETPQ